MNALLVLFIGNLSDEAVLPLVGNESSLSLAIRRSQCFPGVSKTVLLAGLPDMPFVPAGIHIERRDSWTVKSLLDIIAVNSEGFDLSYFAWADCPFLDPALAGRIAERHLRYAAEYSYADGWPYGIAPELLSPGTAAILAKILASAGNGEDGGPVGRDALFSVIQKDINAFDIETEISSVDLRCHRLSLCADSKRNFLLLQRFVEFTPFIPSSASLRSLRGEKGDCLEKIPDTAAVERIIAEKPAILRTLPAFYPVQVYGGCPQSCSWCPLPLASAEPVTERRDFMEARLFESLLDKIAAFSGDAVIDLSLWGELSLHPQKMELIGMVLSRAELSLVIETSGLGWKDSELEQCAELTRQATAQAARMQKMPPLSWIVSLDTSDPAQYKAIRGAGFAEANACARKLFSLFPKDVYIQAVRTAGAEDDIERFYRSWKEEVPVANIIIQKYNDFCGMLPHRQVSDLSPVQRQPCWHLMRDMPILIDGTVPVCSHQIANGQANAASGMVLGNAFSEPLDVLWERAQSLYDEQANKKYTELCAGCDEYYTYNF